MKKNEGKDFPQNWCRMNCLCPMGYDLLGELLLLGCKLEDGGSSIVSIAYYMLKRKEKGMGRVQITFD